MNDQRELYKQAISKIQQGDLASGHQLLLKYVRLHPTDAKA